METLLQYKCPACGGGLSFHSDAQKLKCPYCDTEFEVDALKELDAALNNPTADKMSWEDQAVPQWQEGEEAELRSYACQSCGGEIVTDSDTAATSCPYCGNPVVMAQQLSGSLRPDCIIPFQLDKQAAEVALQKHLSGKILLPKVFRSENHIREIKGIYVPFWLFDAAADGDARYHATRVRTWADSRYTYTETRHFSVLRAGNLRFAGVPVDGSTKMPDDLMESLEPYDLSQAVDFQTAYLAGYYADKYNVTAEECAQRANDRIRESTQQALEQTVVGYSSVLPEHCSVRLGDQKTRYALYPVWLLHTNYRGTDYLFAMNGQTGKLVGNLPMDKGAFWKWWFIAFGIGTVLSALVAWLAGYL